MTSTRRASSARHADEGRREEWATEMEENE
jgi:hypothetical protein